MKTCAFIPNFFKFYNILWQLSLPFLKKNRRIGPSFSRRAATAHLKPADIWIQAASAGEAFLALSLLSCLKPEQPTRVLVTATTSQGREILSAGLPKTRISPQITHCLDWFPFDVPGTIQEAVKRVNPRVMVLLETEIWPALLYYLKENQTQILIVNARLSDKSARHYRWTKYLWSQLSPDHILAISKTDAKKFEQIFDKARITTMSNIKFDLMLTGPETHLKQIALEKILSPDLPLSILASIRRQEESQVLKILEHLLAETPRQVVAIFPRHMHRVDAWKKKLKQHHFSFCLRSQLTSPMAQPGIILWDTFGELRSAYGLANTVCVGGSILPLGGQNFIEPAALGAPTVIGPHIDDFAWVGEEIINRGIVTKCKNRKSIARTMVSHLRSRGDRSILKQKAQKYIQEKQGGTQSACQAILAALMPVADNDSDNLKLGKR